MKPTSSITYKFQKHKLEPPNYAQDVRNIPLTGVVKDLLDVN